MMSIEPLYWIGIIILLIGSILLGRYALRKHFAQSMTVSGGRFDDEHVDLGHQHSDLFEPPSLDTTRLF